VALRRLLALVAAVALIAGAFVIRGQREDAQVRGDAPTPDTGGQTTPAADGDVAGAQLTCLTELAAVCEALAAELDITVVVRDAGALLDTAGTTDGDAEGALLTVEPLPEMMAARARAGTGPVLGQGIVLARSPLVAAVWDERAEVLIDRCGELSWRCVGDAAASPGTWAAIGGPGEWGPVKPGHTEPSSASGLLTLGQLAHGWFGRPDISSRDIDDVGFFSWFTALESAVPTFRPTSGSPLLAMLQLGPASFDVVSVVEAEAVGLLTRGAARAGTLRLRAIEPVVTADVVVTPVGEDGRVEALVDAVAREAPGLLAQAGWRVDGRGVEGELAAVAVDLTLPSSNGLPPGGALEALRRTWSEVAR
jgi:hypothetical protein